MRTLQSGHTVIRADQFEPDGWHLPGVSELRQNNDEGCATNYRSVIDHLYQRPRGTDDDTPAGDHDSASTRSCRPRQKTTSNGNGPVRSHPTHLPTSSPRFMSGKQMHGAFQNHERDIRTSSRGDLSRGDSTAWNTVYDQKVETPRTLLAVRAMRGILRHPVSGISDVDPHRTIGGHPACIATTGATRDEGQRKAMLRIFRRLNGVRGKALPRGNQGTPWKKAPNDCDHPPAAIQKGGNAVMCYELCEMCGNRWQRIPQTMVARNPETKLNNRTVLASTRKRPVEIESFSCPFCPHGHGSMTMQATP